MLLLTLPLSQLPLEIVARLSPSKGDAAAAVAAGSGSRRGSKTGSVSDAAPTEPTRRLLITGDETGRVKVWDADAIIALTGVPSLTEIVALALESAKVGGRRVGAEREAAVSSDRDRTVVSPLAQVDAQDAVRVAAVVRAARRSSIQRPRSSRSARPSTAGGRRQSISSQGGGSSASPGRRQKRRASAASDLAEMIGLDDTGRPRSSSNPPIVLAQPRGGSE